MRPGTRKKTERGGRGRGGGKGLGGLEWAKARPGRGLLKNGQNINRPEGTRRDSGKRGEPKKTFKQNRPCEGRANNEEKKKG